MRINYTRSIKYISLIAVAASYQLSHAAIEEVVVTAQKRAESQQDVPIAIQAFSGDALVDIGITNTDDLGMTTPGLQMAQGGIGNVAFIRGLGNQDASGGQEGTVGTYVDGLWYGSVTGSALSFNNIERIEVLKGPQGTLFGRNTTGGVINIITKDPSHETSGKVSATYGNYDTTGFSLYATTGITDNLAADIAVYQNRQSEGYGKNLITGDEVAKSDELSVRTKWQYTGDSFTATFSYSVEDYQDDKGYARNTPKGSLDLQGLGQPSDVHDVRMDNPGKPWADFDNEAAVLRIDKSFTNFDVVSITGYKDDEVDSYLDNDSSGAYVLPATVDFTNTTLSQEFQILSNNPDSNLSWIMGVYLLDQSADGFYHITGPALFGDGLNSLLFGGTIETESVAGFGEVAWNFTDQTRLTLGLRYTDDEREVDGYNQAFLFNGNTEPFSGTFTPRVHTTPQKAGFDEMTWRIVLDHQMTEDVMVYASYNRGFRSGNFNTVAPADPAFDPEIVDAYEVGIKSDWLDQTLRLNASAYYYEVTDLQFQELQGVSTVIVNAAGAEIKGSEVDLTWQATDNLSFEAGLSYMHGEFDSFPNALSYPPSNVAGNLPSISIDASGNQIPGAPEWLWTAAATYSYLADSGEYKAALRATYNEGFPWEPDGRLVQDDYTLVNITAGWRSPSEQWGIRFNVNNLLDEEYSITTRASGLGDFYQAGAPRTYSATVEYSF